LNPYIIATRDFPRLYPGASSARKVCRLIHLPIAYAMIWKALTVTFLVYPRVHSLHLHLKVHCAVYLHGGAPPNDPCPVILHLAENERVCYLAPAECGLL